MRKENQSLHEDMRRERDIVKNLERLLAESRQQAVDLQLQNKDCQDENDRMRGRVEELQGRL